MNIEKRRAEIAARKAEIRKLIEGDSENKLNMDDLEKELRELNEEDEKLEKRQAIERMLNGGAAPASPAGLSNPVARSANQPAPESTEKLYRSAWLKTLDKAFYFVAFRAFREKKKLRLHVTSAYPISEKQKGKSVKFFTIAYNLLRNKQLPQPSK